MTDPQFTIKVTDWPSVREEIRRLTVERDRLRSALDILCQGIENGRGWPEHIGDVYKHCREALKDGPGA